MKVIKGTEDKSSLDEFRDAFVTIGNFDGVHLGHQHIIKMLIREAHEDNRKAAVITFDPHPEMVLHPEKRPFYLITSLEEKIKLLEELGIDAVILIPFSLEFSRMTAKDFVCQILSDRLHIKKIFIGYDYTFGRDKVGNAAFLVDFGNRLGFDIDIISAVGVDDTIVSSTRIRNAILEGDVKMVIPPLGRPYNLSGIVIEGNRRGGNLGFHTANIKPGKVLIPAHGVYAVIVHLEGIRYRGVINIGFNPTFADKRLSVEVHLLDFDKDIYEKSLEVLFIDRIRDEVKFADPEKLVAQVKRDIEKAEAILKPYF
ncbi:MAG: bifunctional riboflavin kinase/FAD synthetase [Syntrophales bacterium]|nr:bifunctional riboflavin kinase/FAD synthetase [Syntrophales bacterium]